ncbi:hypothetical protein EVAR_24612_1 [Eumeta japonica]|uniref:Uncharacterized protein n=1 Tax=Eumeta variegata TaxID=151549 RepID=A0A4C1V0Z2_EUMVA|nr:hypothetical protein EVAR_24612_1 [Eumeta japonica]
MLASDSHSTLDVDAGPTVYSNYDTYFGLGSLLGIDDVLLAFMQFFRMKNTQIHMLRSKRVSKRSFYSIDRLGGGTRRQGGSFGQSSESLRAAFKVKRSSKAPVYRRLEEFKRGHATFGGRWKKRPSFDTSYRRKCPGSDDLISEDPQTKRQSTVWLFQNEPTPTTVKLARSAGKIFTSAGAGVARPVREFSAEAFEVLNLPRRIADSMEGPDQPPNRPPPPPPQRPVRPKITLQIPDSNVAQKAPPTAPPVWGPRYQAAARVPGTPGSHISGSQSAPYALNPFLYQTKASEFMFKQFGDFKDFTMNTAKSGLSAGEKSAFWFYNKLRTLSKKWFTHIFLLLCLVLYSVMGAAIFVALEVGYVYLLALFGVKEGGVRQVAIKGEKQARFEKSRR